MSLAVVSTVEEVRRHVAEAQASGQRVGLVPTMGALHEGHVSLIRAARAECGCVVVWLFVNPAQFGPKEDLSRYPRPFEKDRVICEREGVDVLFNPPVEVVYPEGYRTHVEVKDYQDVLEGASRPGHFRGVCTVVLKMFNMVGPDAAYFGQKDAQQIVVVRRMVEDLNVPVEVRVCPTVREADGLALSSRNQYLTPEERRRAVVLIESLRRGRDAIVNGERDAGVVRGTIEERVRRTEGASLDYAAVVSAETLEPLGRVAGKVLLTLAVRFGTTRLIDNLLLVVTPEGARETPVPE
jgi:pantoate--beta-alanine ligase